MENNSASLVHFANTGDITVGTIENTSMLDGSTVVDFGSQVIAHIEKKDETHLLLNFMHVQYLSSAALTELIRINDAAKATGGSMRVCNVSADIEKVFKITNFDKLFDIHSETLDQCLTRYQRAISLKREEDEWSNRKQ